MQFTDLDLTFGAIVIILMSLSFVGLLYIIIDEISKAKSKRDYQKSKIQKHFDK